VESSWHVQRRKNPGQQVSTSTKTRANEGESGGREVEAGNHQGEVG